MALKKKTTEAQQVLVAIFEFGVLDTMVDTGGLTSDFATDAKAFDLLTLPFGSQVLGGDLVVKTISDAATTHTVSFGDSGSATRYLGATTIKTAARTALVPTGFKTAAQGFRMTVATTGAKATVGAVKVTVQFLIDGRAQENLRTT